MNLADLRRSYTRGGLCESDAHPDPLEQFRIWFEQAQFAKVPEPNAMALATADADGAPAVRIVLLKEIDEIGFVWYTNYTSQKACELRENPRAALVFYWSELERQVRICGGVKPVAPEESDRYFEARPLGHKIGAWSSSQSSVIPSRKVLEENVRAVSDRFGLGPVPRPPFWGGYRLTPSRLEFWQGRPNRLHDRLEYRRGHDDKWSIRRLSP